MDLTRHVSLAQSTVSEHLRVLKEAGPHRAVRPGAALRLLPEPRRAGLAQAERGGAVTDTSTLAPRLGAEFIGTFALVFAGAGAIVIDTKQHGAITHVGVAATFGLVIMVMIYAVGHISGGHFNPGVTLAFAAARHFPLRNVAAVLGGAVPRRARRGGGAAR